MSYTAILLKIKKSNYCIMKDYLELYQDSPTKIKMRNHLNRKGEEKCGYKHWDHNDDIIRSVEKFIHKNVGNNFDIVYSKFCNNLLPTFPHKGFGKYWFWRMFKYTSYSDINAPWHHCHFGLFSYASRR